MALTQEMIDKLRKIAAESTNELARKGAKEKLQAEGISLTESKVSQEKVVAAPKPKAERKKREPKAKVVSTNEKRESPDKDKDYKTYCDELISKADERKAKAKAAAAKRANEPKKTQATKNVEAVDKTAERVEKNVEKRVKKGDVSVAEIDKIIAEYETALTKLRALREKATSKMRKGGGVDAEEVEHILMRAQGVKEHHCGCNDSKMATGGSVEREYFIYGSDDKKKTENYLKTKKYREQYRNDFDDVFDLKMVEVPYDDFTDYRVMATKKLANGGIVIRNGREYPTGSAWTVEHNKRNKGEKWEQYADGGGVGSGIKYRAEVGGVGENNWSSNAMEYDTEQEAKDWLTRLSDRWFGYDISRVVTTDTPNRQNINPQSQNIFQNFRSKYANGGGVGVKVPKAIIDMTESAIKYLRKKYPKYEHKENMIQSEIYWDMVEDVRSKFDTDTPTMFGEIGEEIVQKYMYK